MTYNIFNSTAPAMPKPSKGTEIVKLLLSQASKDMHEPLVPMLFPILGAHMSGSEFQYPDLTWKEMCGMMANLQTPRAHICTLPGTTRAGSTAGQITCAFSLFDLADQGPS